MVVFFGGGGFALKPTGALAFGLALGDTGAGGAAGFLVLEKNIQLGL